MLTIKLLKAKNGYILVYTCILISLFLLLAALSSKLMINESLESNLYQNYIFKDKIERNYKEYALTYANKSVIENVKVLTTENVLNYFSNLGDKIIYSSKNTNVKYDRNTACLLLRYQYDNYNVKTLQFKFEVKNGKISYYFIASVIISGRL